MYDLGMLKMDVVRVLFASILIYSTIGLYGIWDMTTITCNVELAILSTLHSVVLIS